MTDEPNVDDLPEEENTDATSDEAETFEAELEDDFGGGEIDTMALLAEAEDEQLRARASWHLLPKENFTFLFANCLFFAGAISAWTRAIPVDWQLAWQKAGHSKFVITPFDPSMNLTGLDTIKGTLIFAVALYGFFQIAFNIIGRGTKVWPFVLNALVALEVGIVGIKSVLGAEGGARDMAKNYLEKGGGPKSMLDDLTVPLSTIPPAYWMLTLGGMIVLIVILNGIMSGAKKVKMAQAEEGGTRRRR